MNTARRPAAQEVTDLNNHDNAGAAGGPRPGRLRKAAARLGSSLRFLRWHLGHTIPTILRHTSTYPELPRKSKLRRLADNLRIYMRDGAPCAAYDGLGLDVKGRGIGDFVGNVAWIRFLLRHLTEDGMETATPMQKLTHIGTCPALILQDKFCFWSFMDRHGVPAVPILAHTVGGKLVKGEETLPKLRNLERFFVKPVAANCGSKASIVVVKGGDFTVDGHKTSIDEMIAGGDDFIFQPVIENHADIKEINPSSLNTLRLVTCRRRDGSLELWDPGMMRIGRADASVDNFAKGGIGVGIDESGRLKKYGYSHDRDLNYAKAERHPDSNVAFEGRPVPFYAESVRLAMQAHALFPRLLTVGWDVAVTPDGPILVEGNHDWDIEMLQVVHHKGSAARLKEIYG